MRFRESRKARSAISSAMFVLTVSIFWGADTRTQGADFFRPHVQPIAGRLRCESNHGPPSFYLFAGPMMDNLHSKREQLLKELRSYRSCVIAFSAGVDSTVVAKAAFLALGSRAIAVTGVSASLAAGELEEAVSLTKLIGIRHEVVQTDEFTSPDYLRNHPDRCYHCKTELYTQLDQLLKRFDVEVMVNGANADDTQDYRPGMLAAKEHQVRSPLVACQITKQEVRQLAEQWELPIWNKPAAPCLASRVSYGEEVTAERLEMIDRAEQYFRQQGLETVRVRYHKGDLARVEVSLAELPRLCQENVREDIVRTLRSLGFKFITLDLEGFRSGSLNSVLPVESLKLL